MNTYSYTIQLKARPRGFHLITEEIKNELRTRPNQVWCLSPLTPAQFRLFDDQ